MRWDVQRHAPGRKQWMAQFSRDTNNVEDHNFKPRGQSPPPLPPTQEPNVGIWQLNFGVSAVSSSSKTRK